MFWLLLCMAVVDVLAFVAWGSRAKKSRVPRWHGPAATDRSRSWDRPFDVSRG